MLYASDIPGDSITVTSENGMRVYCKMDGSDDNVDGGSTSNRSSLTAGLLRMQRQGQLLSKPIHKMMEEIDSRR